MSETRVTVDGHTLNSRTAAMLQYAEHRLGYGLRVIQGSYNRGGVSASAGTHDGGGALDVSCNGINVNAVVRALREAGFAAWHRLPSQGPWMEHIHAIAIGDPELSSGAAQQVREYYAGENGLAGQGRDDGPRLNPIPTWPVKLPFISVGRLHYQFTTSKPKKVLATQRVQELLNERIGAGLKTDGVAGPATRNAYKKWEQRIHAPVADGVPGMFSVTKLVAGYYKPVL